jgi:alpha-glucosidase
LFLGGTALLSCTPSGPASARYVLSDGTVVSVSAAGSIQLTGRDGHALVSTAEGAFPRAQVYAPDVRMAQGFFTFRRVEPVETSFTSYLGSSLTDGEVVLRFASPSGANARITVGVETPNVATAIRLDVDSLAQGARDAAFSLPFACDEASSFVGFGAQYNQTDQRGEAFALWVEEQGIGRDAARAVPIVGGEHTTYFPMPWWMDWRGFGVLIDTTARVNVDLCSTDADTAWVEVEHRDPAGAEARRSLRALVLHGPSSGEVLQALGDRIGRPPMPPRWAFSPWIGMQGGRDEVLAEAQALDDARVPYSAVWVQDWVGGQILTGDQFTLRYRWVADEMRYPDLAGMVRALHERRTVRSDGIRFLGYANPFVVEGLDHFDAMSASEQLVRRDGATYSFPIILRTGSIPDFTQPSTYTYVEGFLGEMVNRYGFDGWMVDFGEWLPTDAVLHNGDAFLEHNDYPRQWQQATRNVFDRARPDGDWVTFSRSGWTGNQRTQQIVWIGDQEANFSTTDGLPTVLPALLNMGLSATPLVTHDIAGFSGGPSTKELYMRWTELGAFTTIMRTHEGIRRSANWNWDRDAETTAHFRRFARIHEALVPELVALAEEATRTSMPPMRHLALVFRDDIPSRAISDEFMLGSTLLVAPVVTEGATQRSVYLPPGTWFHVWTGRMFEGGQSVSVEAPIGAPPVFSLGRDRADLRAIE